MAGQHAPGVSREGQRGPRPRPSERARLWPDLHHGTGLTRTENKRVVEITRTMAHGLVERAEQVLACSRGGEVLMAALIERVNGPCRERLTTRPRTRRHAASRVQAVHTGRSLIGGISHCCVVHQERSKEKQWGRACPPAMASGPTDPVWGFGELLREKGAPAPWVEPQRRGPRPQQAAQHAGSVQQPRRSARVRPVLRLRTGMFCSTTVS